MAFFNEQETKEFFPFFQWQDGKTYNLSIEKAVEENFANGNKVVVLKCTDIDTGEQFDRKYEFSLMNALKNLGDAYVDKNTILKVTPRFMGKSAPTLAGKVYDRFEFDVSVATGGTPEPDIRKTLHLDDADPLK